jgi:hypothetical protein
MLDKGTRVRLGTDPWPGSGRNHILPQEIIDQLHELGYFHLHQITNTTRTTIWDKPGRMHNRLVEGGFFWSWSDYIRALKLGHIRITEREDELVWKHNPHGIYTPKAGYTKSI